MTTSPLGAAAANLLSQAQKPEDEQKLRDACQQFEAIFIKQMMSSMRGTVEKSGLIDGGRGEEIFTDMLDQARAEKMSQGEGLGLADVLYRQFTGENLTSTTNGADNPLKGLQELAGGFKVAVKSSAINTAYGLDTLGARAGDLVSPLRGIITSTFGPRLHPISGELKDHHGLDIAAETGTPIVAAKSGTVSFAGEKGGYGNTVIIDHPDGSSSRYAHCQDLLVEEGQQVKAGEEIATVGSTGVSTGPHLHFELRDASGKATDPWPAIAGSFDASYA